MRASSASRELLWPLVFVLATGYLAWYTPRLIVFSGYASEAMFLVEVNKLLKCFRIITMNIAHQHFTKYMISFEDRFNYICFDKTNG